MNKSIKSVKFLAVMGFKTLLILLSFISATSVYAREELSAETKMEIQQDLELNFGEKMSSLAVQSNDEEGAMSPKDLEVLLHALYVGIETPLATAGVNIDQVTFNRQVAKILHLGKKYGALPAAITIGWFSRADIVVGKTIATEMNFYLEEGKLKVSTYDLKTLNVGVAANFKIGYYVALCYGSCTGGDANGSYIGLDADVVYGAGANLYIEVGVDTTDYKKAKKLGESYTMKELYDVKAVYVGVGIDFGVGIGISLGLTDYYMTSDRVIADLYSMIEKPNYMEKTREAFNRARLFKNAPSLLP